MSRTPGHVTIIISRAWKVRIAASKRNIPARRPDANAIRRHIITATRRYNGVSLGSDKALARIGFRKVGKFFMRIIIANQIQCIRFNEWIFGTLIITASCDGTRGIELSGNISQFLGNFHAAGITFIPLFHNLVSDTPDKNAGVIAIASN